MAKSLAARAAQCLTGRATGLDHPLRADWIAELDAEIRRQPGPVVLIAHSLGCVTVALWAAQAERRVRDQVRGALLVAPADVERESCAEALRNFAPISREPLPFPSVLVVPTTTRPAARSAPCTWPAPGARRR